MKKLILLFTLGVTMATLNGCANHRLGQFTVASSHNVQNLNYDDSGMSHTKGEDCTTYILGFPLGNLDDKIQRAMDNAISNGQAKKGKGDLLVNVRIDQKMTSLVLWGQNCTIVEGDLVSLK